MYLKAVSYVERVLHSHQTDSESYRLIDPEISTAISKMSIEFTSRKYYLEQGSASDVRGMKNGSLAEHLKPNIFGSCALLNSNNVAIMRKWDALEGNKDRIQTEFIQLLNEAVPGWDGDETEDMTLQDRKWMPDEQATTCLLCASFFTAWLRRHHCRRCLDIVCKHCSNTTEKLKLQPGAPVRECRVCDLCALHLRSEQKKIRGVKVEKGNMGNLSSTNETITVQEANSIDLNKTEVLQSEVQEAETKGCDLSELRVEIAPFTDDAPPMESASIDDTLPEVDPEATNREGGEMELPTAVTESEHLQMSVDVREDNGGVETVALQDEASLQPPIENEDDLLTVELDSQENTLESSSELKKKTSSTFLNDILWSIVCSKCFVEYLDLPSVVQLFAVNLECSQLALRHHLIKKYITSRGIDVSLRPTYWHYLASREIKTKSQVKTIANALENRLQAVRTRRNNGNTSPHSIHPLTLVNFHVKTSQYWNKLYTWGLAECGSIETSCSRDDELIASDVLRSFGDSPKKSLNRSFESPYHDVPIAQRHASIINVLRTFCRVHKNVGYCQGLNYVAAFLLSQVKWQGHRAFWILSCLSLSKTYNLSQLFCPGLPSLTLRFYQLERLIKHFKPILHEHFRKEELHPSVFASGWFVTLFTSFDTLPYVLVKRVFDWFLLDGWKVLFKVALTLVSIVEEKAMSCDFDSIMKLFYGLKYHPAVQDTNAFIKMSMQYKVTNSMLQRLAVDYTNQKSPRNCSFSTTPLALKKKSLKLEKGSPKTQVIRRSTYT